jgi:diguanylate cyclase (GGDEF)-like protein
VVPNLTPIALAEHTAPAASPGLARRRALLLAAAFAVPTLVILGLDAHQLWPLLLFPMLLAMPLAGIRGLVVTATAVAMVLALVGENGPGGTELTAGWIAFTLAALAVGRSRQITRRELDRVSSASLTDRLTGLYNYGYFADALARECRRADRYDTPLSLVLLDLDGFKAFNDRHGHEAGNRLLAAVGETIASCRRSSDVAARFGGEEFALLVPGEAHEATEAAERIRRAVAEISLVVSGGEPVGTTISAGVAPYVHGSGDGHRMLDQADHALYRSKDDGRDRVSLFEPSHRWLRAGAAGA